MIEEVHALKKRMWRQCFYSLAWKVVLILALSVWLVRSGDGAILMFSAAMFIVASEFTVFVSMAFKGIDSGVDKFGDKFIGDSLSLLKRNGDFKVYHKLLFTTYDGERFKE